MDGFIERVESGAVFSEGEIAAAREMLSVRLACRNALLTMGGKEFDFAQLRAVDAENRLALMLLCNRVAAMMGRRPVGQADLERALQKY